MDRVFDCLTSINDPIALFGFILILVLLLALYRVHRAKNNPYDLSDLITTGDHMDLSKLGQLTALVATTWIVVHMEVQSRTTEWALMFYGLMWVGARFGSLLAAVRGGATIPPAPDAPRPPNM